MATSLINLEEGSSNNVAPDVTMTEAARENVTPETTVNSLNTDEKDEEKNWIKIAGKIRRYKASIHSRNLEVSGIPKKLQLVQQKVGHIHDFLGVKLVYWKTEPYVVAEFGSIDSREEACTIILEENNEFKLAAIENKGDDEFRNRSMTLRNLPLNVNRQTIRNVMERYGEDEVTDIKLRTQGPWLTAVVTFANAETVNKLAELWYILIGKDLV